MEHLFLGKVYQKNSNPLHLRKDTCLQPANPLPFKVRHGLVFNILGIYLKIFTMMVRNLAASGVFKLTSGHRVLLVERISKQLEFKVIIFLQNLHLLCWDVGKLFESSESDVRVVLHLHMRVFKSRRFVGFQSLLLSERVFHAEHAREREEVERHGFDAHDVVVVDMTWITVLQRIRLPMVVDQQIPTRD